MRIEFPVVCHMRCTEEMMAEVKARGGSGWLRSLIAANTRPPAIAAFEEPVPTDRKRCLCGKILRSMADGHPHPEASQEYCDSHGHFPECPALRTKPKSPKNRTKKLKAGKRPKGRKKRGS